MKLHFLEPYRSALMVLALEENLTDGVNANVREISPAYQAANSKDLLEETLQLLVLGDEISLLWTHVSNTEDYDDRGYPYVKTSGLESLDILRLIGVDNDEFLKNEWPQGTDFLSIWNGKRDLIDSLYPVALSQLSSRGKNFSIGIFRLLRAHRLGETNVIPLIYSTLSNPEKEAADIILSGDPNAELIFDMPILGTFRHICVGLADHKNNQSKLVGLPFSEIPTLSSKNKSTAPHTNANEVYAFLVETLLGSKPNHFIDLI